MFGLDLVSGYRLAPDLAVDGMEVDTVRARDQGDGHLEVLAKLIRSPGPPWMISGRLDRARNGRFLGLFEAADIVPLPAREGKRKSSQGRQGGVDINSMRGISLATQSISFFDGRGIHPATSLAFSSSIQRPMTSRKRPYARSPSA